MDERRTNLCFHGNKKSTQASKTQVKRRRAVGKSIFLDETDDWLVVIPLDHDARWICISIQ